MIRVATLMVALLVATAATSAAEIGPGRAMVSIGTTYFGGELEQTGDYVDGNAINLGLDVVHPRKPIGFFVMFGWGQMTTEDAEREGQVQRTLQTSPTFIGGKLWLGPRLLRASVGAAVGVWFSSLNKTVDGITVSETSGEGFGFAFPVGLTLSITRGMNVSAGYTANVFVDNSFLKNNLLHAVNLSVGLSWGN